MHLLLVSGQSFTGRHCWISKHLPQSHNHFWVIFLWSAQTLGKNWQYLLRPLCTVVVLYIFWHSWWNWNERKLKVSCSIQSNILEISLQFPCNKSYCSSVHVGNCLQTWSDPKDKSSLPQLLQGSKENSFYLNFTWTFSCHPMNVRSQKPPSLVSRHVVCLAFNSWGWPRHTHHVVNYSTYIVCCMKYSGETTVTAPHFFTRDIFATKFSPSSFWR